MMAVNASHETKLVAKPYAIEGLRDKSGSMLWVKCLSWCLRVVVETDRSSQILEARSTFD